jgi:hypothetical protein
MWGTPRTDHNMATKLQPLTSLLSLLSWTQITIVICYDPALRMTMEEWAVRSKGQLSLSRGKDWRQRTIRRQSSFYRLKTSTSEVNRENVKEDNVTYEFRFWGNLSSISADLYTTDLLVKCMWVVRIASEANNGIKSVGRLEQKSVCNLNERLCGKCNKCQEWNEANESRDVVESKGLVWVITLSEHCSNFGNKQQQ